MSQLRRLILLLLLGGGVVLLDQWTKLLALQHLSPVYPEKIIEGFFSLVLVMNSGVAFGVFSAIDSAHKAYYLLAFSGITVLLVLIYYFRDKQLRLIGCVALTLVMGGAVGNLIDRWRYQKVVDFLDFYWRGYHWPAFNLADSAITVGVFLILYETLTAGRREV
jgi:signal peptidase II